MNILQKLIDEAIRNSATIRADELRRVQKKLDAAARTLKNIGYYWDGGEYLKPRQEINPQSKIMPVTLISGDDDCVVISYSV